MFPVLLVIWNRFVETRGGGHWSGLYSCWSVGAAFVVLWSGKNLNCQGTVL